CGRFGPQGLRCLRRTPEREGEKAGGREGRAGSPPVLRRNREDPGSLGRRPVRRSRAARTAGGDDGRRGGIGTGKDPGPGPFENLFGWDGRRRRTKRLRVACEGEGASREIGRPARGRERPGENEAGGGGGEDDFSFALLDEEGRIRILNGAPSDIGRRKSRRTEEAIGKAKEDGSRVLFDGRWIGPHGIGRFASEILSRLSGAKTLSGPRSLFLSPLDPVWVSWQIAKERPGVYLTPGFNPPAYSKVPFVVTIHDLIHLKVPEERGAMRRLYYEVVVKPALSRAFCVLTVSEFSRREILEWSKLAPFRVRVAQNGVSPEFSPEGSARDPGYPYFLYVGNRKPHKNLEMLLTALSRARLPDPFRLAVGGSPTPEFSARLRRLGLGERVVFLGRMSDRDLPSVYRGARALLFPSVYEGFGLPVLEAMACGTPVLASRIPAVEEVAGEAACLLPPGDPEAWKEAMERLSESPERARELGSRGPERARPDTWEKDSGIVREVLEQALEEGS
ncbi:MAG: hypothetical protein D084_Lepto4C00616G0006, partial [Leptospirillum sp. Group IV 'UBA BS']